MELPGHTCAKMEDTMRRAVIWAVVTIFFTTSAVSECFCGDGANGFVYITEDPAHYEWMEELPWRFLSIACEGNTSIVLVELIGEGDPALEEGDIETQFSSIIYQGVWTPFPQFEEMLLGLGACLQANV